MKIDELFSYKQRENLIAGYGESLLSNHKFFIDMFDALADPIYIKDNEGIYIYCNKAYESFCAAEREKVTGSTVYDLFSDGMPELHHMKDVEMVNTGIIQKYECETTIRGEHKYLVITKAPFMSKEGSVIGIVGIISDMTESRLYERKLARMNALKASMLNLSRMLLDIKDESEAIRSTLSIYFEMNKSISSAYYLSSDGTISAGDTIGRALLHEAALQDRVGQPMRHPRIIKHRPRSSSSDRLLDDETITTMATPIFISGEPHGVLCFDSADRDAFDEIDLEFMAYVQTHMETFLANNRLYHEILNHSRYDKLTGVFSRRYFEEHIESVIERSSRYGDAFCLVVFDLDNLKIINDRCGHLAGDVVLKQFASAVTKNIRNSDILARYGGDEFIGIFFETGREGLESKLDAIQRTFALEKPSYIYECVKIGFSYGIAEFGADGATYDELFKSADSRMYETKRIHLG